MKHTAKGKMKKMMFIFTVPKALQTVNISGESRSLSGTGESREILCRLKDLINIEHKGSLTPRGSLDVALKKTILIKQNRYVRYGRPRQRALWH